MWPAGCCETAGPRSHAGSASPPSEAISRHPFCGCAVSAPLIGCWWVTRFAAANPPAPAARPDRQRDLRRRPPSSVPVGQSRPAGPAQVAQLCEGPCTARKDRKSRCRGDMRCGVILAPARPGKASNVSRPLMRCLWALARAGASTVRRARTAQGPEGQTAIQDGQGAWPRQGRPRPDIHVRRGLITHQPRTLCANPRVIE